MNCSAAKSCFTPFPIARRSAQASTAHLDSFLCLGLTSGDMSNKLGHPNNPGEGHHWTGPSTGGVWGSMATPQGNETVSL